MNEEQSAVGVLQALGTAMGNKPGQLCTLPALTKLAIDLRERAERKAAAGVTCVGAVVILEQSGAPTIMTVWSDGHLETPSL